MVKKALIITWEKFQDHELIYPYYSLKESEFEVTLMANLPGKIYGSMGSHMMCDVSVSELLDNDKFQNYLHSYDLILIPGGVKALEKLRQEKIVLDFVYEWNRKNKMIFSICNGAQLLISSKILSGRTVSGYYAIDIDIENAGAKYSKDNVVVDGNIISCPHYDFMGEWMRIGLNEFNKKHN